MANINNKDNRVRWQIDCDKAIQYKANVILSSPTGSGKTKRYETWALNKSERPIFITSPIKSLSNQKFRDLQAQGYKVGLETGDVKYIPSDDCDIICCTQEIYDNKYRHYQNSTLIIDEFSYIFDDNDRARVYIDSLYYSKARNIMICSATFGNAKEIKEYINKVTNRNFFLYENEDRLTTLEYRGEISKGNIKNALVVTYSKQKCEKIAIEIYQDRIDKFQKIFKTESGHAIYKSKTHNYNQIREIAKKFKVDNKQLIELSSVGIAYYYGALLPKEKLFIEELFERKLIDTIVGTDALALGVNYPIEKVVFTELTKQTGVISKNLFEQLSGRAGRKGYFDNGYVYYCPGLGNPNTLKNLFYKLVRSPNESAVISLTPNIKDILQGYTTVDDEAQFIVSYSTKSKQINQEKEKIIAIIDYIKKFNLSFYYLKQRFPEYDLENHYQEIVNGFTTQFKMEFEQICNDLSPLQDEFNADIGEAYLIEYTPEENCAIFADVLTEMPMSMLIEKYGKDLRGLLLLRQYFSKLPEKYTKNYDTEIIDTVIDSLDHTVLDPTSVKIDRVLGITKKDSEQKTPKKLYACPNYFETISIGDVEYIKIQAEGDKLLIGEDYNGKLKLRYIPLTTNYKVISYIKRTNRIDILNKIDLKSLGQENNELAEKIEGMKADLEMTTSRYTKKKR